MGCVINCISFYLPVSIVKNLFSPRQQAGANARENGLPHRAAHHTIDCVRALTGVFTIEKKTVAPPWRKSREDINH